MALTQVNSAGIKDGTIENSDIKSDAAIDKSKLATLNIAAGDIADEAITLAKLPHGDGSSDGKFLKSNNGADPTWVAVTSTPEGEAIKSTTNSNETTAKFLRADGDGTCSWQTPAYIANTNTTYTAGTGLTLSGTEFSVATLALTTVQTAANQSAQLGLTTQEGDVVVRTDESKTYMRNSGTAGDMTDFTQLQAPGTVTSVNGSTGAVTLTGLATGGNSGANKVFWENEQTVTHDYTITNSRNAGTFGPVTINSGATVTIGDGEYWTII